MQNSAPFLNISTSFNLDDNTNNRGMNIRMGATNRLGMRVGRGDYSGGFAGQGKFTNSPGSKE